MKTTLRNTLQTTLSLGIILLPLPLAPRAYAQTTAITGITIAGGGARLTGSFRSIGFEFTPTADLLVSDLGVYDHNQDGLNGAKTALFCSPVRRSAHRTHWMACSATKASLPSRSLPGKPTRLRDNFLRRTAISISPRPVRTRRQGPFPTRPPRVRSSMASVTPCSSTTLATLLPIETGTSVPTSSSPLAVSPLQNPPLSPSSPLV
jgi:hypothetical protein